MMYKNNYQSNIHQGQRMNIHALRVLAPTTNDDELTKVFDLKLRKN